MRIATGILGAFLFIMAYYAALDYIDRARDIGLKRRGRLIVSKFVWLTGAVGFCILLWFGYRALWQMPFPVSLMQCVLLWGMSVAAVTDYRKHFIPNGILFIMLIIWTAIVGICVILATEYGLGLLFQSLIGGAAGGLIFLLCYLLSRRQLGAGDIKLSFVMGLYLTGQWILGAIFYGIVLCLIYSVIQLLRKKIGLKDGVPLAPFLYGGVLIIFGILF